MRRANVHCRGAFAGVLSKDQAGTYRFHYAPEYLNNPSCPAISLSFPKREASFVSPLLFPFFFGSLLGTVCGYVGGWLDFIVMRIVDVVLAFPFYVLIIALVFFVGEGTHGIFIAFALTDWVVYARTTRSAALVAISQDWVAAAEGGGLSRPRVLLRHILPNTISQAIVYVMSDIVLVILAVVTLGYLGLGIQPPAPDWGAMISDGQTFITVHPWLSIIPGIAVILTGVGLSLLGDGLADLQRPR